MNLWKMELIHLFRSWRGWTLLGTFILTSVLSILVGIFIERSSGFAYTDALDLYMIASIVGTLLFIGIAVSALSFDGHRDSSIFLRTRFSMKKILLTKLLIYFSLSEILWFLGFFVTLFAAFVLFDSSDKLIIKWLLWGLLLHVISALFYMTLMVFTSSVFRGAIASVLFTLAVIIGIPIIGTTLITVELLMRGLIQTPFDEWEAISFVARTLVWMPAALGDAQAFLSVSQSEVRAGTIFYFGQSLELDAHFRAKSLITSLIAIPLLALLGWRRYTRREI